MGLSDTYFVVPQSPTFGGDQVQVIFVILYSLLSLLLSDNYSIMQ